jgi:hypothetical protein
MDNPVSQATPSGKKRGRPSKASLAEARKQPVGRPRGDASAIEEFKARLMASPKSRKVLDSILDAALDDEHKNQAAAWKLLVDRMLPMSYFEKDKGGSSRPSVNITISGVGESVSIAGSDDIVDVEEYDYGTREAAAGGPQAIAKIVYNNRNGNTEEGDGYKYRGRGFIQVTGKDNYKKLSKLLFGDENVLLDDPEILSDPEFAADASIAWLNSKTKGLTTADEISNVVNSGENATKKAERKKYSDAFEKQLTLNNSGFQVDVDGIIMPEGETETAWNKYISSRKAGAGRGFVNPEFNAPAGYDTITNGAMPVAYDEVAASPTSAANIRLYPSTTSAIYSFCSYE